MRSFSDHHRRSSMLRCATVAVLALGLMGLLCSCHRNEVGGREIRYAAWKGDLARVQVLLKENPGLISSDDKTGETTLHWAANGGHKDVVDLLLADGARPDARDDSGYTPLHTAAYNGRTDVADLLLSNKAHIEARDSSGFTPLTCAASNGNREVAVLLLAHGANVNARSNRGSTPLHWATAKDHEDVAELLRQHGGLDLEEARSPSDRWW